MVDSIPCPHCGAPYPIDYDYLEQFGNTKTLCRACGVRFILPRLDEVFPEPPMVADSPDSTIQYASPLTPQPPGPTHGIWRDRDGAVIERGAELPRRCICCNQPGDGNRLWVKLWWKEAEKRSVALAVLSKPKEDVIAFKVSLCAVHRRRLRQSRQLGNLLMLIGLVVVLVALICLCLLNWTLPFLWTGAGVVFGTGFLWRTLGALALVAVSMDAEQACVGGFGKRFLASLESLEEAKARSASSMTNILERL